MAAPREILTASGDALQNLRDFVGERLFAPIRKPVFIIGCGRSGTTILGRCLSSHPQITYLNEPREIWSRSYPETDIWSVRADRAGGRLRFTADDVVRGNPARLRWLFRLETLRSGRPVLVEKLPINSYRLPWIHAIFTDARFIHIHRHGMEVARSIAALADQGRWFGVGDYKWQKLVEYASGDPETAALPDLCVTNLDRGLLEWRLANDAIRDFLDPLPADRYVELAYDELVAHPAAAIERTLSFIDLEMHESVTEFVESSIKRRSPVTAADCASEAQREIGGARLQ